MTPKYRIVVEIDPYHYEDSPNGGTLPESEAEYVKNECIRPDGAPMSYAEYCRTYGDPDRYTGYVVTLQAQCECCGLWKDVDSVNTSMYDDPYLDGTYDLDDPKYYGEASAHLMELGREMIP